MIKRTFQNLNIVEEDNQSSSTDYTYLPKKYLEELALSNDEASSKLALIELSKYDQQENLMNTILYKDSDKSKSKKNTHDR